MVMSTLLSSFPIAIAGQQAIYLGGPAAHCMASTVAKGINPFSPAFFLDIIMIVEAPEFIPGAFPAVTVGLPYTVFSLASFSREMSFLACSSLSISSMIWARSNPTVFPYIIGSAILS
jgi:hypothetical protein